MKPRISFVAKGLFITSSVPHSLHAEDLTTKPYRLDHSSADTEGERYDPKNIDFFK